MHVESENPAPSRKLLLVVVKSLSSNPRAPLLSFIDYVTDYSPLTNAESPINPNNVYRKYMFSVRRIVMYPSLGK
ncbi:hypothetical protein HF325_003084 [Metschnikowia pulcherrima]|uniref:Uncharacterized protein n=1 Tax=Metschnikowia pulcherrima TaxID=27326 RepID=A0A8H7GT91_9ASCO|nr:hypothetical protein HF325_003084 [Metschnikowia pulcherrima]